MTEANAANSEKNSVPEELKPYCFKPGQSGNPSGRPKKKPITEAYLEALQDPETCKQIAQAAILHALKGDGQILREVTDRVEGRVSDKVEHSGADGGPIQSRIIVEFV